MQEIAAYNRRQLPGEQEICEYLNQTIDTELTEASSKIWHGHPVWFIEGNPVVGYSKLKEGIRLMFWSGVSFNEQQLVPGSGKFKDASITYQSVEQVDNGDVKRWLEKAKTIQWDYKNIVKRKGHLERLQ